MDLFHVPSLPETWGEDRVSQRFPGEAWKDPVIKFLDVPSVTDLFPFL